MGELWTRAAVFVVLCVVVVGVAWALPVGVSVWLVVVLAAVVWVLVVHEPAALVRLLDAGARCAVRGVQIATLVRL